MKKQTKKPIKPARGLKPILWSIALASREFGVSRDTVRNNLTASGVDMKDRETFTTQEIVKAVYSDLKMERIRKTRAEADGKEMENKLKAGDLTDTDAVKEMIRRYLGPTREILRALPGEMASRCNPSDPKLARLALTEFVDGKLKTLREI